MTTTVTELPCLSYGVHPSTVTVIRNPRGEGRGGGRSRLRSLVLK